MFLVGYHGNIISYFNSRTSCEVRRIPAAGKPCQEQFQLTHLLRGATSTQNRCIRRGRISTHAPLARCDRSVFCRPSTATFQLTHLLRGATRRTRATFRSRPISTHAPLARCDCAATVTYENGANFNSRTSCEVRPAVPPPRRTPSFDFNSRTSCEVRL